MAPGYTAEDTEGDADVDIPLAWGPGPLEPVLRATTRRFPRWSAGGGGGSRIRQDDCNKTPLHRNAAGLVWAGVKGGYGMGSEVAIRYGGRRDTASRETQILGGWLISGWGSVSFAAQGLAIVTGGCRERPEFGRFRLRGDRVQERHIGRLVAMQRLPRRPNGLRGTICTFACRRSDLIGLY
ncbi:hypothetical protein IMZ48_21665 [Candidatus Bathyarchaeota archaeon]|nr:hypothetical protein [Candidatus Bathyarchaeota archaeon]